MISKEIELDILAHKNKVDVKNVGYVLQAGDGVAKIYGLNQAMLGEKLLFSGKDEVFGMAFNLEEHSVSAILFGDAETISEGDEVVSSGKLFDIEVGEDFLGRVVDPLGRPLDGRSLKYENSERMLLEDDAPKMFERKSIDTPLQTGIKIIDSMIPIGLGQRELIIGDRHTGKTALVVDTILNQKDKDIISVYVSIGQKQIKTAKIMNKLGDNPNVVMVAANASDSASMQFLAPYAGCAIAEYFMKRGKDVLIVYDDLSKHAVAYREISLLLRRPPGREAYPGDVFFIHSRLLERAANLKQGSITALPIVETQAGDISSYIPTNIISITDGQIYLDNSLFNSDFRPAINIGNSVSRVGSAAQTKLMKSVSSKLKVTLAQYREIESFSRLSSTLDKHTQDLLDKGGKILELLKQEPSSPLTTEEQIVLFYALQHNFFKDVLLKDVKRLEQKIYLSLGHSDLRKKLLEAEEIGQVKEELEAFLKEVFNE